MYHEIRDVSRLEDKKWVQKKKKGSLKMERDRVNKFVEQIYQNLKMNLVWIYGTVIQVCVLISLEKNNEWVCSWILFSCDVMSEYGQPNRLCPARAGGPPMFSFIRWLCIRTWPKFASSFSLGAFAPHKVLRLIASHTKTSSTGAALLLRILRTLTAFLSTTLSFNLSLVTNT